MPKERFDHHLHADLTAVRASHATTYSFRPPMQCCILQSLPHTQCCNPQVMNSRGLIHRWQIRAVLVLLAAADRLGRSLLPLATEAAYESACHCTPRLPLNSHFSIRMFPVSSLLPSTPSTGHHTLHSLDMARFSIHNRQDLSRAIIIAQEELSRLKDDLAHLESEPGSTLYSGEKRITDQDSEGDLFAKEDDELISEIDPLLTQRQQEMAWKHDVLGIIGLKDVIASVAEEEIKKAFAYPDMMPVAGVGKRKRQAGRALDENNSTSNQAMDPDYAPTPRLGSKKRRCFENGPDGSGEDTDEERPAGPTDGTTRPRRGQPNSGLDARPTYRLQWPPIEDEEVSDSDSPRSSPAAGKTGRNHVSWRKIIDDCNKGAHSRVLFYLASCHTKLRSSLIEGTLPSDMQDADYQGAVGSLHARARPGAYSVYVALNSPQLNTQAPEGVATKYVGWGLTMRDTQKTFRCMREYYEVDQQTEASIQRAKEIDQQRGRHGQAKVIDYASGERRCGPDFRPHRYLAETVEENVLSWMKKLNLATNHRLGKRHLKRCFSYSGISYNVWLRTSQHGPVGKADSDVYALLTAILSFLFKDKYDVVSFFYQILKTVSMDDINICEIMLSIMTSSFVWDGGLNKAFAGGYGRSPKWDEPSFKATLQENADSIARSGFLQGSIDEADILISHLERAFDVYMSEQARLADDLSIATTEIAEVHVREELAVKIAASEAYLDELVEALEHLEIEKELQELESVGL